MPVLRALGLELNQGAASAANTKVVADGWSDDESCFGPPPRCPAYFNTSCNGKCAVRTQVGPRGEYPPMPVGSRGFVRDSGATLFTLLCKGAGAPVILHSASCRKCVRRSSNHGSSSSSQGPNIAVMSHTAM